MGRFERRYRHPKLYKKIDKSMYDEDTIQVLYDLKNIIEKRVSNDVR